MKADQWAGLVTKASPYIVPAGAAVEQVNLQTSIPGQLTTRGGMGRVACTVAAEDIVDCFACDRDGVTVIVALKSDGSLVALPSPAASESTVTAQEPPLTLLAGQTGATYTQRFAVGPVSETTPNPPSPAYVSELFGGSASTPSWPRGLLAFANYQGAWFDGQYTYGDVVLHVGSLWITDLISGGAPQYDVNGPVPGIGDGWWRQYSLSSSAPPETTYYGGSASTDSVPPSVLVSSLSLA